tara:strand:+ start:99 stop:314 length:216 start_codon:yes stop_codon:yes gene_type:complete
MIESEERHYQECELDTDDCYICFCMTQAKYAISEAHEEKQAKKNQPKAKPPVKTKPVYDYRLQEWRSEVVK